MMLLILFNTTILQCYVWGFKFALVVFSKFLPVHTGFQFLLVGSDMQKWGGKKKSHVHLIILSTSAFYLNLAVSVVLDID